jgi:predicted DNA-binding transcriptional regulator YafY
LWYLVGWCRLRGDEREFRLDRVRSAATTPEIAPSRPIDPGRLQAAHPPAIRLDFPQNADRTVSAVTTTMGFDRDT